jgi:hypothetical protein
MGTMGTLTATLAVVLGWKKGIATDHVLKFETRSMVKQESEIWCVGVLRWNVGMAMSVRAVYTTLLSQHPNPPPTA